MSLQRATVQLLREALEERLSRRDAAAILFDVLTDDEATGESGLVDVVHGRLRAALTQRLSPSEALHLLRRIEEILVPDEASTGDHGALPEIDVVVVPEEHPTGQLPMLDGAASVMVFSATDELAINLGLCLGQRSILVRNIASLREMTAATSSPPDVVIVDCKLPTPIDHRILASTLGALGSGVLCIVWGVDLEVGERFVAALEGGELRVIPIALSSGVAPILDLLMSRAPT